MGEEFGLMVQQSIEQERLPNGMTRGTIVLLPKGGDRQHLTNWRLITLLNTSYKIVAKALQLWLQNVLVDVISPKQSAFLPRRYILDNVLLQAETIAWAKQSQQDLIFLKLDFQKAHNSISWEFLFQVMVKLNMPKYFVQATKLLFRDARASVCINNCLTETLPIQHGLRQGCPVAPFLFLIVGEALHVASMSAQHEGELKGISLPR